MEVEYRLIVWLPGYRVGNDGSVWSCWGKGPGATMRDVWREMKVRRDREGYRRVSFRDGTAYKVGVLVLTVFVGPCPDGMECCHGERGNADDALDNVRWGTHVENIADKRLNGTMATSDRHGKTKLTDAQIAELLALKGQVIQQAAADRFGVSRGYVGQLWAGSRKRVTVTASPQVGDGWRLAIPKYAPSECHEAVSFAEAVYFARLELDLIDEGQDAAEAYTAQQICGLRKFVADNRASLAAMAEGNA